MAVTIKDVARESGFGVGTVSRVLNGSPYVKDRTREKILQTAKQLEYKPNKIAKLLVTKNYSLSTIGIVLPQITHKFSMEIVGGIYESLNKLGYNLLVFNIGKDRESVFEHIRFSHFSGLLVLLEALKDNEKEILRFLHSQFIYLDFREKNENSIFFNNFKGGELAADYLVEKKCRNIVFIGDKAETQQKKERLEGFRRQLASRGLTLRDERYIPHDETEAYRLTRRILQERKTDGIFFYCDDLAFGGLKAKIALKSRVRIIGYDDIPASEYLRLSTVKQDAHILGKLGGSNIVRLIEKSGAQKRKTPIAKCLSPELIDRGS